MNILIKLSIISLLSALFCGAALAESNWSLRVGAHTVEPDSDNGGLVQVDSGTSLTFDITYRINPNWRVEILAAAPFNHEISLVGATKVAETDQFRKNRSARSSAWEQTPRSFSTRKPAERSPGQHWNWTHRLVWLHRLVRICSWAGMCLPPASCALSTSKPTPRLTG